MAVVSTSILIASRLDSTLRARYAMNMNMNMNMNWRHLAAPIGLALLAASVGCTSSAARGYCEAQADCEVEFIGIVFRDEAGSAPDAVAVCTATQVGRLNALRANEEQECLELADFTEVYFGCIGSQFADNGDGCEVIEDDCDDERDDLTDALNNVDGNECSSSEG